MAIEAWVRDVRSAKAVPAIDKAAGALLGDLLGDFGRTYTWNDVRNLPEKPEVRSMTAVATRLRVIAEQLQERHGADQVMRVHHEGRGALWVSFEACSEDAAPEGGGTIRYEEAEVMLTWLGRLIYGRLPSSSRLSAPGVYPTLVVVLPFFVSLYLFYHGLFTANVWLLVSAAVVFVNLVRPVFRILKLPVTQAHRVEWPYVVGPDRWGVIHTRTRLEDKPLFRIAGYKSSCPICGDTVDLEPGRHQFTGRIVGECRSNPLEHLFSFDHTTGKGRWLFER
ncbi:hypothetical protein [Sphingomonas parapaucimobilis]|uniref:hypothetical protein n=1 Tax=Sphingomonas parapaucimobilis TaxID=28213 RepID=UPI0035C82CF9